MDSTEYTQQCKLARTGATCRKCKLERLPRSSPFSKRISWRSWNARQEENFTDLGGNLVQYQGPIWEEYQCFINRKWVETTPPLCLVSIELVEQTAFFVHLPRPRRSTVMQHIRGTSACMNLQERTNGGPDMPITPKLLPTLDREICGRRITRALNLTLSGNLLQLHVFFS